MLSAAAAGAELADLAALAEEMRRRLARPDRDPDGFLDRQLHLDTTLGGAGKLWADLTPRCAAALQAVLDTLGKKAGPEDARTVPQRRHDALEEACRRLIGAGCLPDRAGQSAQIQLHMTLQGLVNGLPGDDPLGLRGYAGQPDPSSAPAPWPAAMAGDDCDAVIAPVVTGHVDHDLLDRLAARLTSDAQAGSDPAGSDPAGSDPTGDGQAVLGSGDGSLARRRPGLGRQLLLAEAIELLSGPAGLASWLRTGGKPGPAGSISLPLDLGTPTEVIPPHLRRAVILRDQHCGFPGCDQLPAACQVHHVKPRSEGGLTTLPNLLLLCSFHHLILVHRWGWSITLNLDGTTTARSPDGRRAYRSHSPPDTTAALMAHAATELGGRQDEEQEAHEGP